MLVIGLLGSGTQQVADGEMDAFVGVDDTFGLGSLAGAWSPEDEYDTMRVVRGEGGGVKVWDATEVDRRGERSRNTE